jgi:hypothetical protein
MQLIIHGLRETPVDDRRQTDRKAGVKKCRPCLSWTISAANWAAFAKFSVLILMIRQN